MKDWGPGIWLAIAALSAAAIYILHRLLLRLEARGYIYYLHHRSSSGVASSCIALQEFVQPDVRHVHQVKEQKREREEEEGIGDEK